MVESPNSVSQRRTVTMPILLWALGSFVFFKVALDASFYPDVTVVASLLMGAMTTTSVYASSSF